jgi:CubicO group peptidase (beta-lactamase class C family)
MIIDGNVAPAFQRVRDAFRENFEQLGDVGAAFAAYRHGEKVVDLWGGWADRDLGAPWSEDTAQFIFSGTKGFVAASLLLLRDRGLLDESLPVAHYWPEFAQHGKGDVTVRHILTHTGGVPGIREPIGYAELADDVGMAQRVAAQEPFFPAGAELCYHPLTFGTLGSELVKRIDGRSVGRFFAEEFAVPLGLDAWIGIPAEQQHRVSTLVHGAGWGAVGPYADAPPDRAELIAAIINNPAGRHGAPIPWNRADLQRVEVPGANGIATARSIARFYALLANGGELDGTRLLSPEAVSHAGEPLESRPEWLTGLQWTMGPGFQLNGFAPRSAPGVASVGHGGAGGSVHGYWPELGVSFSYAMNELRAGEDLRAVTLLDALHESVTG